MLIVFGGLPGTGKQAIRRAGLAVRDVGALGYGVADVLAADTLGVGRTVVVDCVNPVAESRDAWRTIASQANVRWSRSSWSAPMPSSTDAARGQ